MIRVTELGDLVCGPETPIREALARINGTVYLFQLVLDEAARLLGTVTDGDVRRGILGGVTLDDPIRACMKEDPLIGRVGADADNRKSLRSVGTSRAFLPLVDEDGIVREVVIAKDSGGAALRALVMAGGRGTRLGERTKNTPKPLIPVGDKPILEHVLERLEAAEVAPIHVAVHYLAEQIQEFLACRKSRTQVHVIHEEAPLGTAGAIARLPRGDGPLLVLNGDILTRVDIQALSAFHDRHGYDATIAVAQHEVQISYGVVRHGDDGAFLGVEEKPSTTHFVAAGMYLLSPEITALVPPDRPMDMPELLNLSRSVGLRVGLFPIHEYWVDVGCPDDLAAAQEDHESQS